jgi:hypothetical protein
LSWLTALSESAARRNNKARDTGSDLSRPPVSPSVISTWVRISLVVARSFENSPRFTMSRMLVIAGVRRSNLMLIFRARATPSIL